MIDLFKFDEEAISLEVENTFGRLINHSLLSY